MSNDYTTDKEAAAIKLIDFGELWSGRADAVAGGDEIDEIDRRQFFTGLLTAYNVDPADMQKATAEAESYNSSGPANELDVLWPKRLVGRAVEPGSDLVEALNATLVEIPESADNPSLVVVTDFHRVCKLSLADDSETETIDVDKLHEHAEDFMALAFIEPEDDDEDD
ncbi:type IIL restriction-modification enzyme MmeI [Corynebacterium mendelii]|uniref:MmeI-like N-terminal domain-containing protein n=1 Tax=Corynebacterium mendelii TaxID=2765362 RepID=A0A939IXE7_9CORY|nr:type IIL restriction-modification enzyme MmeI [Corynebacterium mendelii]MBN9643597.1 hypothetical protein [Corynebacterium mendelii]